MTTNSALIVPPQASPATNGPSLHFQDALKPLIDIPNLWAWVIGAAIGAVALAGAYALWRVWRKKARIAAVAPPLPPHVRARRALEAALRLIGEPKAFSIAVSGAIRNYLEERFLFHAPERTTEEFLYELRATDLLTGEQKSSLGDFLAVCDLIKFAKYEPTETELRDLHRAAGRLVDETEPRWTPEAPAPSRPPVMAGK